jgi:hypothetical protein
MSGGGGTGNGIKEDERVESYSKRRRPAGE